MRLTTLQAAIGSASLFLSAQPVSATIAHRHAHEQLAARRHAHGHHHRDTSNASTLEKRASCSLPSHPDLVPVPGAMNSGFAMAGDVACLDGKYCPYACVPGKVMAQWQPNSKYVYPESMVRMFARVPRTDKTLTCWTERWSQVQQRCRREALRRQTVLR
jgi:hypothetical protein